MRLHRFFVSADLRPGTVTLADAALCHQLHRVLRLRADDRIILVDGKGGEAEAAIASIQPERISVTIGAVRPVTAEPQREVALYCAVLKRENFEWAAQKAVEAGAKRIVPVLTERTVKTGLKIDRLRVIAREAAEQSGRGLVPVIDEPMSFTHAADRCAGMRNIFFDFGGDAAWQTSIAGAEQVNCWIGPEGGWTAAERRAATDGGFLISSLGQLTLRAETAAAVATYLAVNAR